MKKCSYCQSSYGSLIFINNSYWHKKCLIAHSKYNDYIQGKFNLEKSSETLNLNLETNTKPLTSKDRQKIVYEYIKRFIHLNGKSPTIDHMIKNLGYKRQTINNSINSLIKRGFLKKEKRKIMLIEVNDENINYYS